MNTKEFFKRAANLTAVVYTITSAIIVLGALFAGSGGAGMMKVTDVKTHLFLFLFSIFSGMSITLSKHPKVASSAKYFVEGGGMTLSFLLFVVLPKDGMKFAKACGWLFGFIIAYILVRVVISIMVYDEKSTKKNVKTNQKNTRAKAKKVREDAILGKNKKDEVEYTSLFSSDNKNK